MPSAFPDTTWERRFRDLFLRANSYPFEINYALMFNPDPYLWGKRVPYTLEVGVKKTIESFFKEHFSDPHYKKIDGRPLVFFFLRLKLPIILK
jgi:hypothetical protein